MEHETITKNNASFTPRVSEAVRSTRGYKKWAGYCIPRFMITVEIFSYLVHLPVFVDRSRPSIRRRGCQGDRYRRKETQKAANSHEKCDEGK